MNTIGIFVVASRRYGDAVAPPHQDIDVQGHKLGSHALEALGDLVGEAMLKLDIASVDVAQICKAFEQRFEIRVFLFRVARMPEIADKRNLAAGLLCPSHARQRNQCAADESEDITPPHVEHGLPPFQ
jgi:hypothetical protein